MSVECAICRESAQSPVSTKCGHVYCKECLLLWFEIKKECPTCKTQLLESDYHPLFISNPDPEPNPENNDDEADEQLKKFRMERCRLRKSQKQPMATPTSNFDLGQLYLATKNIKFYTKLQSGNYPLYKCLRHKAKYMVNAQGKALGGTVSARSGEGVSLVISENGVEVGSVEYITNSGWKAVGDQPHETTLKVAEYLGNQKPQFETHINPTTSSSEWEGPLSTEEKLVVPKDLVAKKVEKPENWVMSAKATTLELGKAFGYGFVSGSIVSVYTNWDDFFNPETRKQAFINVAQSGVFTGGVGLGLKGLQVGAKEGGKHLALVTGKKGVENALTAAGKGFPFVIPIGVIIYQLFQLFRSYRKELITDKKLKEEVSALLASQSLGVGGAVVAGGLMSIGPLGIVIVATISSLFGEWMVKKIFDKYEGKAKIENAMKTLELGSNFTRPELRRNFARLALRHHPDRAGNSEESHQKMLDILISYETLQEYRGWE